MRPQLLQLGQLVAQAEVSHTQINVVLGLFRGVDLATGLAAVAEGDLDHPALGGLESVSYTHLLHFRGTTSGAVWMCRS